MALAELYGIVLRKAIAAGYKATPEELEFCDLKNAEKGSGKEPKSKPASKIPKSVNYEQT